MTSAGVGAVHDALVAAVGVAVVSDRSLDRLAYGHDTWPVALKAPADTRWQPDLVAWPGSTEDVAAIVRIAADARVPVVPVGGLSGIVGGALAVRGGIALDLLRMNLVLDVDPISGLVRVQAGVDRHEPRGRPGRTRPDHRPPAPVVPVIDRRRLDRPPGGRHRIDQVRQDRDDRAGHAGRARGRDRPGHVHCAGVGDRADAPLPVLRCGRDAGDRGRGDPVGSADPRGPTLGRLCLRPGRHPERRARHGRHRLPPRTRGHPTSHAAWLSTGNRPGIRSGRGRTDTSTGRAGPGTGGRGLPPC